MTMTQTTSEAERVAELEAALREVVEAADRQLAYMGKGREPSPKLQAAFDRARQLVPSIREQESPSTPSERE